MCQSGVMYRPPTSPHTNYHQHPLRTKPNPGELQLHPHTSVKHRQSKEHPLHTDPPPPNTHTPTHPHFFHSDLSSLSHPLTSHPSCRPAPPPLCNHLPSCRKFLMISIISARAVSPAKSRRVRARTNTRTYTH